VWDLCREDVLPDGRSRNCASGEVIDEIRQDVDLRPIGVALFLPDGQKCCPLPVGPLRWHGFWVGRTRSGQGE
ncbi:MAG: hypothetical protein ACUVTG_14835, partial [Candidatus Oleimicrobiaceae bacterium]